jgi:hypothetical protein
LKKIIVALAVAFALLFSMTACTGDDVTDPSVTTLRYEGGSTVGRAFKECVAPGSKLASDDTFYPYPNTQRQDLWDSSNTEADHKDMGSEEGSSLTDNSGVGLRAKVNVQFFLNTSCDPVTVNGKEYKGGVLQAYHELVGKTRHAYFKNDGTYGQGWLNAMNYYISAPVEQYLNTATKQYTAQQLWLNQKVNPDTGAVLTDQTQPGTPVQQYIADALTTALPGLVNDNMQTDLQFYDNFKVNIIGVSPDSTYLDLFKQRQAQQVQAQTAQDNAAAQVAQAEADQKVKHAQALALQEVINGYGSVQAYLESVAIEKGLNPFPYTGGLVTTGGGK